MSQPAPPNPSQEPSSSKSVAETLLSPSILEAVPDAAIAVNRRGVIIQANSQTETLFSYPREELVGQEIEMLVPDRQRPEHDRHREQFHSKPKIRRMGSGRDLYGRRRDGSEFPVEISLSPVSTPDGMMVLSVIRDISDRMHIEEELRRANAELDRRKTRELRGSQNRLALIVDSFLQKIRNGHRVEYFESVRITKDRRLMESHPEMKVVVHAGIYRRTSREPRFREWDSLTTISSKCR